MQYFDRDGKFNFVDENNVFVGYDNTQSCCENADWFIADQPSEVVPNDGHHQELPDWSEWRFDPEFFEEHDDACDGGGIAIFKLVSGERVKYLHLFNNHNGYYGHGFEMKVGTEIKHTGWL